MEWKKSSFSNGNGGNNCVEVLILGATKMVTVRHSVVVFPMLTFTEDEWKAFIDGVKAGEFDV